MNQAVDSEAGKKRSWQISLRTLLPAALALLVVLAVAPVIAIGYVIGTETVQRLLSERADLVVDGLENQIRGQLDPVVDQIAYARRAVAEGVIDPNDPDDLRTFALGLLAGTPQVFGVGVIRQDLSMQRWERQSMAEFIEPPERLPLAAEAYSAAENGQTAYWAAPFVSLALGDTILNYRAALERDGVLVGVLAVGVTSTDLSGYVAETSEQFDVTAFVFAGKDQVITYPGRSAQASTNGSTELPPVSSISNPILANMWDDPRPLTQTPDLVRSTGHWTRIDDVAHAYYYRELEGYAPAPLIVGVAIPSADTWIYRWAATIAAGIGLVLMAAAAAAAWRMGVVLSRPAADFDGALDAIARLEFHRVALPRLVNSHIREWRTISTRIEDTARALSAFRTYLPLALVRRIFRTSADGVVSQQREVTVMFIDLEGFTAFSDGRDSQEVVAFLNTLFATIGPIIEASGGVIDKYTGDGMLAFWGAPDEQPDHAARACRAAASIAEVIRTRSARAEANEPRLRIGLHSGPAVVGNIGFPGRIDYTLVGDTVNIAAKTEAALRGVEREQRVVIAATQEVFAATGEESLPLIKGPLLERALRSAFLCRPLPDSTQGS